MAIGAHAHLLQVGASIVLHQKVHESGVVLVLVQPPPTVVAELGAVGDYGADPVQSGEQAGVLPQEAAVFSDGSKAGDGRLLVVEGRLEVLYRRHRELVDVVHGHVVAEAGDEALEFFVRAGRVWEVGMQ